MARTIVELAAALGLEDPKEWRKGREKRTDLPFARCWGRTTNMLLEALLAMESGKHVCIASYHSLQYADDLTHRLMRYAEALGLRGSLIAGPVKLSLTESDWRLRGWDGIVFADHYLGERPASGLGSRAADSAPPSPATEQPLGPLDESPNEATPSELPSEDVTGRR